MIMSDVSGVGNGECKRGVEINGIRADLDDQSQQGKGNLVVVVGGQNSINSNNISSKEERG